MRRVQIHLEHPNKGEIFLDGEPLTGVSAFRLNARMNHYPRLEVEIPVVPIEFDGEVELRITRDVRKTLVRLGWTPPASESETGDDHA